MINYPLLINISIRFIAIVVIVIFNVIDCLAKAKKLIFICNKISIFYIYTKYYFTSILWGRVSTQH